MLEDFISSDNNMTRYNEEYHISNNSAHDRLVQRQCLLGKMLTTQKNLEVPTAFKVMGAYSLISAICGSHSKIYAGGEFSLNLWVLLVGPSGGRKSSAMIPYQTVMQKSEYLKTFVLPENCTTAALRQPLKESHDESLQIFGNDARSQGMIFAQEFHDFFDLNREGNLSSHLTKLWGDQPSVKIGRLNETFELIAPTLSILGSLQTRRVIDVLPLHVWTQGFYPRMITVYSDQDWPDSPVSSVNWREGQIVSNEQRNQFSYQNLLVDDYTEELIKMARSSFFCGFDDATAKRFNNIELPRVPVQLQYYANRRKDHLRKLAALTAISRYWASHKVEARNVGVIVNEEDFEIARLLLSWNDCMLPKFLKDCVVGPDNDMYLRLDEFIREKGGSITEPELQSFTRNQVDATRLKTVMSAIKSYYLDKNEKTGKWQNR